eukprot:TRINITY_DN13692_c0_g1_i1.p1 TRINITY_DN13692_c0_g1~~TRINITY_DN13692_c0_g1_i1.p1  ORF type:complete len:108 (-),score=3.87 TRINITY_DN13692_c0_g1_i1:79-402(-)
MFKQLEKVSVLYVNLCESQFPSHGQMQQQIVCVFIEIKGVYNHMASPFCILHIGYLSSKALRNITPNSACFHFFKKKGGIQSHGKPFVYFAYWIFVFKKLLIVLVNY